MKKMIVLVMLTAAGAALAHEGVKNPTVKARMDAMSQIGAATKVLGTMAKGAAPFDATKAQEAAATIADTASRVPALFEPEEDDPMSEALPAIWQNFSDFSEKSNAMETAGSAAATDIQSIDDLKAALGQIGGTCQACHKAYRKP